MENCNPADAFAFVYVGGVIFACGKSPFLHDFSKDEKDSFSKSPGGIRDCLWRAWPVPCFAYFGVCPNTVGWWRGDGDCGWVEFDFKRNASRDFSFFGNRGHLVSGKHHLSFGFLSKSIG